MSPFTAHSTFYLFPNVNYITDRALKPDLLAVHGFHTPDTKAPKHFLHRRRLLFQVESTSKQSVYKFLRVLEGLRDWEICSPDISAAIEFCRERIVDLSVEEYEEWFRSMFPRIKRPQTAPPALRGDRDKKNGTSATPVSASFQTARPAVRQVQSAFARRSQR